MGASSSINATLRPEQAADPECATLAGSVPDDGTPLPGREGRAAPADRGTARPSPRSQRAGRVARPPGTFPIGRADLPGRHHHPAPPPGTASALVGAGVLSVLLFPLPALGHHRTATIGAPPHRRTGGTMLSHVHEDGRPIAESPNRPATTPPAVLTGLAVITGIDLARPTELGGCPSGANGMLHRFIGRPVDEPRRR